MNWCQYIHILQWQHHVYSFCKCDEFSQNFRNESYYIVYCNSILLERLTHFLHDWTFFVGGDWNNSIHDECTANGLDYLSPLQQRWAHGASHGAHCLGTSRESCQSHWHTHTLPVSINVWLFQTIPWIKSGCWESSFLFCKSAKMTVSLTEHKAPSYLLTFYFLKTVNGRNKNNQK